ncbi:MAG: hypothetical protein GQF41_3171 [Candidatus Rifleibacterium amylolyticum]|nr:MAG: hypothetical protein GQF41_3171 [Candidatus Rifleibacterium amylolyticum]
MNIIHKLITSPTFELVKTIEFDLEFPNPNDSDIFSLRVELFQSMSDPGVFRYKIWRTEMFCIQSKFPKDEHDLPKHEPSNENILVEFGIKHFQSNEMFKAKSIELAIMKIFQDFDKAIEHISGQNLRIKMPKNE